MPRPQAPRPHPFRDTAVIGNGLHRRRQHCRTARDPQLRLGVLKDNSTVGLRDVNSNVEN